MILLPFELVFLGFGIRTDILSVEQVALRTHLCCNNRFCPPQPAKVKGGLSPISLPIQVITRLEQSLTWWFSNMATY